MGDEELAVGWPDRVLRSTRMTDGIGDMVTIRADHHVGDVADLEHVLGCDLRQSGGGREKEREKWEEEEAANHESKLAEWVL
jgi:hypothetical protein